MLVPNKFYSLKDSILGKSVSLLGFYDEISILELFENKKNQFEDVSEFILALDLLFLLDKISMTSEGNITYVKKN